MIKSKHYSDVAVSKEATIKTGIDALDSFISRDGGFVKGSSIFLTGTPGAGKTTLAVILQRFCKDTVTSLYSREMSASSIKNQVKHYEVLHNNAYIADINTCPNIREYLKEIEILKPKIIIVDSLQVIMKEDFPDAPVEKAAFETIQGLRKWAEDNSAVLIVIGHVTKEGEFEGRNTILHMFDAHLEMIYDKKKNTRTLSWGKNRKGPIGDPLYYIFGKDSIEFYTKTQWDIKFKFNNDMTDYINANLADFLVTVRAQFCREKNYNAFSKDFNTMINNIPAEDKLQSLMYVMANTDELMKKYKMI